MHTRISVYDYRDPVDFLNDWIAEKKPYLSGLRKRLATLMGCQPSYATQVLNGQKFISPEQGYSVCEFLGLNANEREYFLALVMKSRAGTVALKAYFDEKLKELKVKSLNLKEKIPEKSSLHKLSEKQIRKYYSSWHFPVVHLLLGIDGKKSDREIADIARLSLDRVQAVIRYLVESGLVEKSREGLRVIPFFHHLDRNSDLLTEHLRNGLLYMISRAESLRADDVHYNLYVSIDEECAFKIKSLLNEAISKSVELSRSAKDQSLYNFQSYFVKMT